MSSKADNKYFGRRKPYRVPREEHTRYYGPVVKSYEVGETTDD